MFFKENNKIPSTFNISNIHRTSIVIFLKPHLCTPIMNGMHNILYNLYLSGILYEQHLNADIYICENSYCMKIYVEGLIPLLIFFTILKCCVHYYEYAI